LAFSDVNKPSNLKRYLLGFVALAAVLSGGLLIRHLIGPRVVARASSPDGVEMCIVQRLGEPFATGFYFRKPGGQWGWFYFDHEDWYWARSRVVLNTNHGIATFYRDGARAISFDWKAEKYVAHRLGRTMVGAQSLLPDGKTPWLAP
jgi:hypothetical protein